MELPEQIERIRSFNRFYTKILGLLDETYLDSRLSLTEVRIMLEIGHNPGCTASWLMDRLGLDRGHLSRILAGFVKQGLLNKQPHPTDRRAKGLLLTEPGQALLGQLEKRSGDQLKDLLTPLAPEERNTLTESMATIRALLDRSG